MKPISLLDAPDNIKNILIKELGRWQQYNPQAKSLDEARKSIEESTTYNLKMLWLGRLDKLGTNDRLWTQWVSENLLDKSIQYQGVKPGEVVITCDNHSALARDTFNQLWDLYTATPDVALPVVEEKKSFLKKIFGK